MTLKMVTTFRYNTKVKYMKETIDKLDFIKIINFCTVRDMRMRKQATDWGKIFMKDISDKEL